MKLALALSIPQEDKQIKLEFPARYSELTDTLERLGIPSAIHASGTALDEYGRSINSLDFKDCNIFEVNHFAQIVEKFGEEQTSKITGALILMGEEKVTLEQAINLAMNITQNNIVDYQPARDECDLAEFHLENDLIPALSDVTDDAYQWIVDHTNFERLGNEIVRMENGTFVSDGYITMGKLENLYDGTFPMPPQETYIFKLEVGYRYDEDDGTRYTLPMPTSQDAIQHMMKELEVEDLSELSGYKFQSIIPLLDRMDFDMTEVETLNQLATSLAYFKESEEFDTYKAMVDALDIISLDRVHNLCELVQDFELKPEERDFASFGRNRFANVLPKELLECLDTKEYGRKLAEKNGVSMTDYGTLIPKDGVPLMEKLRQLSEVPSQGMTMGQSM